MEPSPISNRDTAIAAAIGRGVSLRTVCAIFNLDAMSVRHVMEGAGQPMPVDPSGPNVIIAEREAEMLRRALAGEDFAVIAKAHDVSREWVRLVVKKHTGLSAKDLKTARDAARLQFREQRARDLAVGDPDLSLDDVARLSSLTIRETENVLGPAESARRRRGRAITTAAPREQILDDLRSVASLPGGTPLSGPFYDSHRGERLSSQRVIQIFGTWTAACEAAGVEAPNPIRSTYTQRWSREDCLGWVRKYLDSTDRPTFTDFDSWLRNKDGAPSAGTVRLRCGTWIETVRDAYAVDDSPTPRQRGSAHTRRFTGPGPAAPSGVDSDAAEHDGRDEASEEAGQAGPNEDGSQPPADDSATPLAFDAQGRQSDVDVRRKVEEAAQERLVAHYEARGWRVKDTHLQSPYDALATRSGETLYLEAKGTQSSGQSVLVTRGEVEHARTHPGECVIGIWSGVEFDEWGEVRPDSGQFRIIPFEPESGVLKVVGYEWQPDG